MPSDVFRVLSGCALTTVLGVLSEYTDAMELGVAAELGGEYTSNTLLTEDSKIGEWIFTPGLNLQAAQDTASLEMDLGYSYLRRIYTKDYWPDDNRLVGKATVDWHALPERLDFFVYNTRTESTLRALDAMTPSNRQTVSTTDAGSRLLFQPRAGDELQLEYLYRDISSSESLTDSQRNEGTIRYLVGLSKSRELSFEGTYSDIQYEGPFPDADYQVVLLGYDQSGGTVDLMIRLGYNWFDRAGRGSADNPAYDGRLTWHVDGNVDVILSGSQRITDQGSDLASGGSAVENTDTNAAFEQTQVSLGYQQRFGPNTIAFEAYRDRQEYASDVPLTNTRTGARAVYTRNVRRNVDLTVSVDFSNRDYVDQNDDQDELRSAITVAHRFGRSLVMNWGARYEKRDTTMSSSYDVWYADIRLEWTFFDSIRK